MSVAWPDWSAYLDALAEPRPDPGGGSAAAAMLALGSALVTMVASYPSPTGVDLAPVAAAGRDLRTRAEGLVVSDAAASARLVAAWRSGQGLAPAAVGAARSCLDLVVVARAAVPLLERLAVDGSPLVRADVGVAAAAYAGAVRAAALTFGGNVALAAEAGARPEELTALRAGASDLGGLVARLDGVLGDSSEVLRPF